MCKSAICGRHMSEAVQMDLRTTQHQENHACQKLRQLFRASDITKGRRESTTISLFDYHHSLLHLKCIFTPTDKSLSKQIETITETTTEQSTDHEELRLNGYSYSTVPTYMIQRTLGQKMQKECKSQNIRKLGVKISPKNGCKNKTEIMAM